jgi:threonylcarbamoyladenosine tRNA methylthiotransferase MtaB
LTNPLRVAFFTLGCKLNQLETESFADAFARQGATVLPGESEAVAADLVVVNTCTVTGKAERKARRVVRLALAANPEAVVLITGCYAQVDSQALADLDARVIVLPGSEKDALLGLPAMLVASGAGSDLLDKLHGWLPGTRAAAGRFAYNPGSFAFHSRPALKIQDGCDNECAYCRVRIARGKSASLPAGEALSRARALEKAGRAEIVLTGVNLSQYRDREMDFPALLDFLVAGTEGIAFRLSSYEPDRVDAAFLEAFAHPRVRPHLHLAVQSGADAVLAAMGRRYRRGGISAAVAALRRVKHDPFIAADLIAGFPGESEADAAATLELAKECDFAWIHAFRFSPRPGTAAASMPDPVPQRLASERAEALSSLGKDRRAAYVDRWMGAEVAAVLESTRDPAATGATTENYLRLDIRGLPGGLRPGQTIACRIEGKPELGLDDGVDAVGSYRPQTGL